VSRTKSTPKKGHGLTRRRDWKPIFLKALAESGNVTIAARQAKVGRTLVYETERADPAFKEAWLNALEEAADLLEEEARRRAYKGVKKPVFQGGECVGFIQEYSDTLLIFLLKGIRPKKFRDRHEVDVPPDSPLAKIARLVLVPHGEGRDKN
jgi:hypothetical protein